MTTLRSDAEAVAVPLEPAAPRRGNARRIALNSLIQAGGEAGSRIAMLLLYAIMARTLGEAAFGDFTSATSLSLFVSMSALGMDYTITRVVAQSRADVAATFWNATVVKVVLGTAIGFLLVSIAAVGGYHTRVIEAVALLSVAVLLDAITLGIQGVFRGIERTGPIARGQLLQRFTVAFVAGGAMLAGAGLVTVSAVWLAGSALGLSCSAIWVRRQPVDLGRQVSLRDVRALVKDSAGLGASAVFGGVLARLDVVVLGVMKSASAVADYGAAYRLFEATIFVTTTFGLASFPVLSRLTRETTPTIGQALVRTLKTVWVVTVPVGAVFVLLAAPIARLAYGSEFVDAASIIRLLGVAVPLLAVFEIASMTLAAQNAQRVLVKCMAAGALSNAALNVALIPPFGADGAAAAMTLSLAAMDAALIVALVSVGGRLSLPRFAMSGLLAAAGMAAVGLAVGPHLVATPLLMVVYAVLVYAAERLRYPDDLRSLAAALRRQPLPT